MPESSLPPPPPTHGNGLLIGSGLVALLLVGGLVFWRVNSGVPATSADAKSPVATPPQEAVSVAQAAPPPPPPPPAEGIAPESEHVDEGMASDTDQTVNAESANSNRPGNAKAAGEKPSSQGGNAVPTNDGCSGSCANRVDAALSQAVRQRGASAKNCYNAALRSNPNLQGKVLLKVRVSPNGSTCSASIASDTLGDPSVTSCIVQKFKGGGYPKPTSGCADFEVPLSFVPSSN